MFQGDQNELPSWKLEIYNTRLIILQMTVHRILT